MAARAAKRTRDAETALSLAGSHDESEIAGAANFNLGVLLEEKGDEVEAEAALLRARKLGSPQALAYSSREAAERKASEEVAGPPAHIREAIERDLRERGEVGELKWREELYQEAVDEGDGEAADEMGLALMHEGKLREAEEMFRTAIDLGHMHSTVSLGLLLEGLGDLEGAEAAFREAAEHDFADGVFNLGVLLNDSGDPAAPSRRSARPRISAFRPRPTTSRSCSSSAAIWREPKTPTGRRWSWVSPRRRRRSAACRRGWAGCRRPRRPSARRRSGARSAARLHSPDC